MAVFGPKGLCEQNKCQLNTWPDTAWLKKPAYFLENCINCQFLAAFPVDVGAAFLDDEPRSLLCVPAALRAVSIEPARHNNLLLGGLTI